MYGTDISYRPFRACVSNSFPNPGRCPGLSPITPLGLKTNYPDAPIFAPNAKSISYQPNIIAIHQQYQRIPRASSYRPFRACASNSFPNPGRCPGLSPFTPLGLKTNYPNQPVFRPIVAPIFGPHRGTGLPPQRGTMR